MESRGFFKQKPKIRKYSPKAPYDREVVSPGVVKRVFEAYYAKILVPIDELHVPDKKNLTPQTLALYKTLFPEFISD